MAAIPIMKYPAGKTDLNWIDMGKCRKMSRKKKRNERIILQYSTNSSENYMFLTLKTMACMIAMHYWYIYANCYDVVYFIHILFFFS